MLFSRPSQPRAMYFLVIQFLFRKETDSLMCVQLPKGFFNSKELTFRWTYNHTSRLLSNYPNTWPLYNSTCCFYLYSNASSIFKKEHMMFYIGIFHIFKFFLMFKNIRSIIFFLGARTHIHLLKISFRSLYSKRIGSKHLLKMYRAITVSTLRAERSRRRSNERSNVEESCP